jgi:hypothetical protein
MDKYINNTQSSFTNYLAHSIDLNEQYQVGLAEISYTQDVLCEIGNIFIDAIPSIDDDKMLSHGLITIDECADRIPFENLIIQMNDKFKKAFTEHFNVEKTKDVYKNKKEDETYKLIVPIFSYNDKKFKITIPKTIILTFNGIIGEILKIPKQANELSENNDLKYQLGPKDEDWEFEGSYLIDPILHLKDNYYVYTDIIKNQHYGNELTKIIRNVQPIGLRGEQVSLTFQTIHYVDLIYTELKAISIYIRDSQERLIRFNNKLSKVVVKLHFKSK